MIDPRCKCTMAISMTGDGCRYCQTQEYIERLHTMIDEERSEARASELALKRELLEKLPYELNCIQQHMDVLTGYPELWASNERRKLLIAKQAWRDEVAARVQQLEQEIQESGS